MIVRSIATLRISFAGGGTDIAEYSREHGGAIISATINYCSHTHLKPSPGPIRLISLDFGTDEKIEHFAYDGKNDLVKATLKRMSRSESVAKAFLLAKKKGLTAVAFVGDDMKRRLARVADDVPFVQSDDTPRIQEAHIVAGHIVCDLVEAELTGPAKT